MQRTQDDKAWNTCTMGYSIMNNALVLNYTVELHHRTIQYAIEVPPLG